MKEEDMPLTREQMIKDMGSISEAMKYSDGARYILSLWRSGDYDSDLTKAWEVLGEELGWNPDGIGGVHSQDPFLTEHDREEIQALADKLPVRYLHEFWEYHHGEYGG